jgi:diguanylate cyclase (GGDEF)-like protein
MRKLDDSKIVGFLSATDFFFVLLIYFYILQSTQAGEFAATLTAMVTLYCLMLLVILVLNRLQLRMQIIFTKAFLSILLLTAVCAKLGGLSCHLIVLFMLVVMINVQVMNLLYSLYLGVVALVALLVLAAWDSIVQYEFYIEGSDIFLLIIYSSLVIFSIIAGYVFSFGRMRSQRITFFTSANYDHTTRLINKDTFLEFLSQLKYSPKKMREQLALLHVNIDNFRHINDNYNADIGDSVLSMIADVIKNNTRPNDLVARLQKDEFIILLQNVGAKDVQIIAERMRKNIEESVLIINTKSQVNATVSIGAVRFPKEEFDPLHLLNQAQTAMKISKRNGKNCVSLHFLPSQMV